MKQVLQFIYNHWTLSAALGIILLLLIFEELKNKISSLPKLTAQEAILLMNHKNALVVDLRSTAAFTAGHILGALNIEAASLMAQLNRLAPHKDKPLILIGDHDSSATSCGKQLRLKGFTQLYILTGGIASWKNAQLPLTTNNT